MCLQNKTIEQAFILNPHASFITLQDAFNERLEKALALVHAALNDEFSNYPKETIFHYLAIISDFMEELKELQQRMSRKITN